MTSAPNKANLLAFTALCFLAWGILSLVLSLQLSHESAITWSQAFVRIASVWVVWPVFAPLLYLLTRRLPLNLTNWKRALPAHLTLAACTLFLASLIHSNQQPIRTPRRSDPLVNADDVRGRGERRWTFFYLNNVVIFLAITAGCHSIHFYRKAAEREQEALRLTLLLNEAQLKGLSMQLQPHFLFNALNSIAALMHEDVERADAMIVALADFLRMSIHLPQVQELPLIEELVFVRRYLAVESIRFGERLEVLERIPPEVSKAAVPSLILQPLLENAFRHCFSKMEGPCLLKIQATHEGETLRLSISDNGPGLRESYVVGTGLQNSRARLQTLYPDRSSLTLRSNSGCTVEISLPFRTL